jgi:hypothetical protein
MVLTLGDMPTGFKATKRRYVSTPEAAAKGSQTTTAADYRAWGFVAGYEINFTRDVSLTELATGAVEIDSYSSVYRSTSGAHASMVTSNRICQKPPFQALSVGARLGDESHLCSFTQTKGNITGQVYIVVFRRSRFKGSIFASGIKGGASASEAVSLAKVQVARMHG